MIFGVAGDSSSGVDRLGAGGIVRLAVIGAESLSLFSSFSTFDVDEAVPRTTVTLL
jgi:hypothetical protein